MAKRRKTRAQKKLADFRHNFTHSIINQTVTKPQVQFSSAFVENHNKGNAYPYLVKDLSKTAILTITILAGQILLYFLLTNHIFKVFGLNY